MRTTLTTLIKLLHEEMQELTVRAGVDDAIYNAVVDFDHTVPDSELHMLSTWLQELRDGAYAETEKIWKLHPPKKWGYYFMMEGHDMKEMQLLQACFKSLRDAWRKPYAVKKEKGSAEPNCNAESRGTNCV